MMRDRSECTQKKCQKSKEALRAAVKAQLEEPDAGRGAGACDLLWDALVLFQGTAFYTAKELKFTYQIKGYEMFVDRKDKSITRATVELAFHRAIEVQREEGRVSGPKKLKTFGASYLYPIFIELGVIQKFGKNRMSG